ncbi:MAG TPA: DUF3054 domain-containing protein [Actinomycetota bacterium]
MRTARRADTLRRPWILALGDAVAIVLFAVIGLASHREGETAAGLVRNAGPVLAGFLAAALAVGTYRRPGVRTLAAAWILGVPAGVLLRAAILGHGYGTKTFTFMAVTVIVTGLLLAAWRGLLELARRAMPSSD